MAVAPCRWSAGCRAESTRVSPNEVAVADLGDLAGGQGGLACSRGLRSPPGQNRREITHSVWCGRHRGAAVSHSSQRRPYWSGCRPAPAWQRPVRVDAERLHRVRELRPHGTQVLPVVAPPARLDLATTTLRTHRPSMPHPSRLTAARSVEEARPSVQKSHLTPNGRWRLCTACMSPAAV